MDYPILERPIKNSTLGLNDSINGELGYSINLKLTELELETITKLIRIQWLYRLQLLAPKHIQQFDALGILHYHKLAHLIDHSTAWPKFSRVFPKEAVAIIKQMGFFKKLESEFGMIQILDEEDLGWENIYWRLVRPGTSDFGTLHADQWFVDLGYYGKQTYDDSYEKIKIWIAINTELEKNGLLVVPNSHHKKDWKWHPEDRQGQKKPVIDENVNDLNVILLPTESGRAVVFHYDLLHGGAPNLAETTRVSIECTFIVKRKS